jgi:signal transduction histidine kinase
MQIVINLIGNSIKFTENGFIKLLIKKPETNVIEFEVLDTGIGMTQE